MTEYERDHEARELAEQMFDACNALRRRLDDVPAPTLSGADTREDLRGVLRLFGQAQRIIERLNEREIPKFEALGPGDIVW